MPWRRLEAILINSVRSFGYRDDLEVDEGDTMLRIYNEQGDLVESFNLTELAKDLADRGVNCT